MNDAEIRRTIPPWFPLVTEPGGELRALRSLAYRWFNPFLPMVRSLENVGNNIKRYTARPMLSGYIFVHLPERFGGWDDVRACAGVADFMRVGGIMATLSDEAIALLRAIEADLARPETKRRVLLAKAHKKGLSVGQKVRTTEAAGPWSGYEAIIKHLDDRDRATLELIGPGPMVPVTMRAQWLTAV